MVLCNFYAKDIWNVLMLKIPLLLHYHDYDYNRYGFKAIVLAILLLKILLHQNIETKVISNITSYYIIGQNSLRHFM